MLLSGHRVVGRHAHAEAQRGRPPVWEGDVWWHRGLRSEQSKGGLLTTAEMISASIHVCWSVFVLSFWQRQQVILTERWAQQHKEIHFSSMHPGWADTPGQQKKRKDISKTFTRYAAVSWEHVCKAQQRGLFCLCSGRPYFKFQDQLVCKVRHSYDLCHLIKCSCEINQYTQQSRR